LQGEWTEEAVQRIAAENTTLKQSVRELTADSRTLDERLAPSRVWSALIPVPSSVG
jgi:hypothetical protein